MIDEAIAYRTRVLCSIDVRKSFRLRLTSPAVGVDSAAEHVEEQSAAHASCGSFSPRWCATDNASFFNRDR